METIITMPEAAVVVDIHPEMAVAMVVLAVAVEALQRLVPLAQAEVLPAIQAPLAQLALLEQMAVLAEQTQVVALVQEIKLTQAQPETAALESSSFDTPVRNEALAVQ